VDTILRLYRTLTFVVSQWTATEQTLEVVGVAQRVLDDSGSGLGGVLPWGDR
jgi:hypothetical protein